jgi:hypothetical protein
MPETKVRRKNRTFSFSLSSLTASTDTILLGDMAGGALQVATCSTNVTQLNFFASDTTSGPFYSVYDSTGNAIKITTASSVTLGRIYNMPDEVFALPFVRITADHTAGNGVSCVALLKG